MSLFNFYEIKSQKSAEFVNGLRKTSLVCLDHPEIHFFLWLDEGGDLSQVQFLFDENLIEWNKKNNGLRAGETNRKYQISTNKTGTLKGARTIQSSNDVSIIKEGLQIINSAEFPGNYDQLIKNNLLFPYVKKK